MRSLKDDGIEEGVNEAADSQSFLHRLRVGLPLVWVVYVTSGQLYVRLVGRRREQRRFFHSRKQPNKGVAREGKS